MSSPAPCPSLEIIIASDLNEARRVQAEIEAALRSVPFADHDIFAIKHGNQLDRAKAVRVAYRVTVERFDVQITDEGPGFDPDDVPDPTAPENLERPCGRGLLLMRHYMTEVAFTDRGRAVHMAKVCNGVK